MPPPTAPHTIMLFDGVCNLCSGSVRWIIRFDRRARLRFASLQSPAGRAALAKANAPLTLPDSVVLIDARGLHTRSTAIIRLALTLGFPWSLAAAGLILPRPLRDWIYDLVARNRYRWFGHRDTCMVPTPDLLARFLDADEPPPPREP